MSEFNPSFQRPRRKSGRGRRPVLGRAGITALAALIATLAGAGLVTGCASHAASPSAAPTVVITKTVTAAPVSATASAPAPASAPALAPTPAASGSATPTASAAAATGDGTQLGAYTFQLTNGYAAPLAPTAPTQSQMVSASSGSSYDIAYNGGIWAGSNEKIVSLPNGSTPTYSACTTGTAFTVNPSLDTGTAFCIIETSGQVAGVVLSALTSSPDSAIFKVTIWKYVS